VAVIQISKIQVRRGLQENLPTLASGEFGWSIDERRLYIGNGTLSEGAPSIGVTEVLTEFSSMANSANIALLQANVTILQGEIDGLMLAGNIGYSVLADNIGSATNTALFLTSSVSNIVDYKITRGTIARVGSMKVTQINGTAVYEDDYAETADAGIVLSVFAYGNNAVIQYTTTSTTLSANLSYNIRSFV
jgi:Major tropism determinant N-terminal domain